MNKFFRLNKWYQLSAAIVYCQNSFIEPVKKIEQPIVVELNQIAEQMTYKNLLKQTCTLSVNSSCQMITVALVALSDASQNYNDELIRVMNILEDNKLSVSELENTLMEFRYHIADAKTFYLDSVSAMDSALQLGKSSVQMSFTVEANTVFNIMSERLYSAEKEFQSCIENIKKIENKFTKLLADTVEKIKNEDNLAK